MLMGIAIRMGTGIHTDITITMSRTRTGMNPIRILMSRSMTTAMTITTITTFT